MLALESGPAQPETHGRVSGVQTQTGTRSTGPGRTCPLLPQGEKAAAPRRQHVCAGQERSDALIQAAQPGASSAVGATNPLMT